VQRPSRHAATKLIAVDEEETVEVYGTKITPAASLLQQLRVHLKRYSSSEVPCNLVSTVVGLFTVQPDSSALLAGAGVVFFYTLRRITADM
jgi:hypothetical protein